MFQELWAAAPSLKTVLMAGLTIFAVLALVAPMVLPKLRTAFKRWITEPAPAKDVAATEERPAIATAEPLNVDKIVQQRASALKSACPKAETDLRLKWLEQGFDDHRARVDYIAVLEERLAAAKPTP
jgi:hypothetical protein